MQTDKIGKKQKYFIQSLIIGVYILLITFGIIKINLLFCVLIGALIIALGVLFTQYPNVNFNNFFLSIILPVHLVTGAVLFMFFFPNLSNFLKITTVISFSVLYYLISLVDNVLLVVGSREEIIPLYRVAQTWAQILLVVIAIPLFAGVLKLNFSIFYKLPILCVSAFLFNYYQIWSLKYEKGSRNLGILGNISSSLLVSFFVLCSSIATSFIPAESFLRSLFVSATLMFGLVYVASYIKSEINKKLIIQYSFICVIFLLLLMLFKP